MATVEGGIVILDDPKDTDHIEVGMMVAWVDRTEGAFGFHDYDIMAVKWQKFLWRCKKLFRKTKK